MILACQNSNSLPLSLAVSSSQGQRYSDTKQLDLIALFLDDPSDPPALEKGQMTFFRQKSK